MKNISRIFVFLSLLGAVILSVSSCNGSDPQDPEPLSVVPLTLDFKSEGGTLTADVTSGLAWTAESNNDWISVTYDEAKVTVTVGENTGEARTGSVTVKTENESKNISISQAGYNTEETLSVNPTSLAFESSGGTQSVNVTSNASWTPTPNDSWITVATSGSVLDVTVSKNTGDARTGSVTITTSTKSETVTITQKSGTTEEGLTVNPTSLTFNWHGDEKTVTVTGSNLVITPNESWITVTENSGSFAVLVSDNAGNRTGTITVTSGTDSETVTVNQRLAADDLVGTWASTEFWIQSGSAYTNDHDVYITKVDDNTIHINNLIWLSGDGTINGSDNAVATIDSDNQSISIAFQEILPTIDSDGWDSYWAHLISSTSANCWGAGFDNRVLDGYTVDIAGNEFSAGTVDGNPVYGSFLPITRDPDNTAAIYNYGFYCVATKWTKTSDDPQPAKASFSTTTRAQRPISADRVKVSSPYVNIK